MKLNRITTYMVGAMALLAGCADDDFIDPSHKWDGTIPDELTLTLTIPDPEIVRLGDTRGENGPISTVTLMQYDAAGNHLGNIPYDETTLTQNGEQWTLTATLNKETRTLQVVANADDVNEATDPSTVETGSEVLEAYTGTTTGPILWASAQIAELLDDTNQSVIALQRQAAKLTVEVEDDADFSLSGFLVCGMAENGTVAPKAADLALQKPTVPTGVTYSYESSMSNSDTPLYFFEGETATADGKLNSRIILKGTYNGQEYYYVAAFRTRTGSGNSEDPGEYTYTDIPVLRNHWYKLTVEKVRGEGWKTLQEAKTAMPDNRTTVWLEDQTDGITDMVATRDYMLGVSGEVSPEWDVTATISVLAKFADNISAESKQKLKLHLSADQDWIKLTETQKDGIQLTGETMEIEIALSKNASSTDDREGTLTVTLGKLSRTVKIIQQGRPLRRERRAIICGLPGVTGTDAGGIYYYQWIDGTGSEPAPQGMAESENRGENRNDALIFTAVPAYELYYKIPMANDDIKAELTAGSGDFTLDREGEYYIVKAKNTSAPHIAKGELTIINNNNAVLKYDLLQTGYFHKLNPADGNQVAVNDRQASGWFYYEVVRFGDMYILDRNLGASTNASYDPTSISYTPEDDKAIGGYFKVNTGRAGASNADMRKGMYDHETITTVSGGLGMKYTNGFFIPLSENEMKAIGLNGNRSSGSVSLTAEEGYVADGNCIYIPAAGYYYGTSKRNDLHVNLWTRTLLGGTQGLTETDDEYGMNYRILDIFGQQANYQGLRISSGSGATLKTNLMRYLPLRLVWKSGTNTEITEGSATSTPTPPDPTPDMICVYFQDDYPNIPNTSNGDVYIEIDNKRYKMTSENIAGMIWWKYTSVPSNASAVRFCSSSSGTSHQSQQYTSIADDYKNYGSPLYYQLDTNNDWHIKRVGSPVTSGLPELASGYYRVYWKRMAPNSSTGNLIYLDCIYSMSGTGLSETHQLIETRFTYNNIEYNYFDFKPSGSGFSLSFIIKQNKDNWNNQSKNIDINNSHFSDGYCRITLDGNPSFNFTATSGKP